MPKCELTVLVIDRVRALGQEMYDHHQALTKWRDPPWTDIEKTRISVQIQQCAEEQRKWLDALEAEFETA